jgi:hypothetical protein
MRTHFTPNGLCKNRLNTLDMQQLQQFMDLATTQGFQFHLQPPAAANKTAQTPFPKQEHSLFSPHTLF